MNLPEPTLLDWLGVVIMGILFGVNAFLDMADMLMSGEIYEETFIQGITDHKSARSDFGLKPYNSFPAYME